MNRQNNHILPIFGIEILNITYNDLEKSIENIFKTNSKISVNFLNANNLNISNTDQHYNQILKKENQLLLPDGSGLKIAAKIYGQELKENLNGTDLFPKFCRYALKNSKTVFFLGGTPEVLENLRKNLKKSYPGLRIVGSNPGYNFNSKNVISKINKLSPDFFFVALVTPLQEKWIDNHFNEIGSKIIM